MSYKHLRFFDKSGDNLNFSFNEETGYWEGNMYFSRVSIGLYENEHIFILENVVSGSPGSDALTFPILGQQSSPVQEVWRARWETNDAEQNIFQYQITEEDGVPYITRFETIEYGNPAVPYTEISPDEQKMVASVDSEPMKLNLGFSSFDEDIYDRTLIIEDMSYSTPRIVAKIALQGETVGEDDRLRLMLENFGRKLTHGDAIMLRDYDIKEALPDYQMMNEKRKEMFVAGEEIFPYMGAYKGLINIVRFFGYQDMRIKEYWLNVDQNAENYGKVLQVQIDELFSETNKPLLKHPLIPSKTYRKTGNFGLFYDITVETGEIDQFGIPGTQNAFMFSNEEVLLKLFALKEKLKREYVPLNARIVDIVGEGIYFERYGTKSWTDELKVIPQKVGTEIEFEAAPTVGYIRDIRRFMTTRFSPGLDLPVDNFGNVVNPYSMGQQYPPYAVPGLIQSIEEFYDELKKFPWPYRDEKDKYIEDEPGVIAGCPIILKGKISQFTWDDLDIAWDDVDVNTFTWDTIDFSMFYEIEWIIEKLGDRPYYFQIRGSIKDYYNLPHFLPYTGKYRVTMNMYDMFNAKSIEIKNEYIEVLARELQIAAFARWRNFAEYTWDSTTDTWDDLAGSTWEFPIEGISLYNSPIHEQLINWKRYRNQEDAQVLSPYTGQYEDLNIVIAESEEKDNPARRFGTTYAFRWMNMDVSWDELYHSTWDMMDYHGDFLGGFKIYNPQIGDSIRIDDYPWFTFVDQSPSIAPLDLFEAVAQLQASTNPGLMKFDFHVFEAPASPPYIKASAKSSGADGWHFVDYMQATSPGGIVGDPYSWTYPTWLVQQNDMLNLLTEYPSIDPNMLFLDTPLDDLITNASSSYAYWQNRGFVKTEPLGPEYPTPWAQHRGHLPSWAGSQSFGNNDLRVFKDDFEVPLGVPVFFIHNHSEIPGKDKTRWVIINEATGATVIDVKHENLIFNFIEESTYSIECWVEDSHGNPSHVLRKGYVKASGYKSFGKTPLDLK